VFIGRRLLLGLLSRWVSILWGCSDSKQVDIHRDADKYSAKSCIVQSFALKRVRGHPPTPR
ncbi:hypothetical protein, partial [Corynebacterium tapiri]